MEPDAGLGNGGLGRLAACYLDSMTTLEIPATGYSICYELGIFKQKIVEGQQVELPDNWKHLGDAWLCPSLPGGPRRSASAAPSDPLGQRPPDGGHEDYTSVLAVPCDMEIAGYDTDHVNTLRRGRPQSPKPIDMKLFSQGQYLQRRRGAGHGRRHLQGAVPRGQPLRGQVPAAEAAVFLRVRHRAVHHPPAYPAVRHAEELPREERHPDQRHPSRPGDPGADADPHR